VLQHTIEWKHRVLKHTLRKMPMYIPSTFLETRTEVLHAFIRKHSFATLISHGAGGLDISHLPMLLNESGTKLLGHLARANPHWQRFDSTSVTAVFHGPHTYVSPRYYTTRAAVPTWNYANVYAHGQATVVEDRSRLEAILEQLTFTYEARSQNGWSMGEVPTAMRGKLVASIVGIEITIEKLEGKFKLNQNRPAADRASVIEALNSSAHADDKAVAEMMQE
jgi:transcriptional regulator